MTYVQTITPICSIRKFHLDRLRAYFAKEIEELFLDSDFQEEPRRLDEIVTAVQEFFDRIWYHRSLQRDHHFKHVGDLEGPSEDLRGLEQKQHRLC